MPRTALLAESSLDETLVRRFSHVVTHASREWFDVLKGDLLPEAVATLGPCPPFEDAVEHLARHILRASLAPSAKPVLFDVLHGDEDAWVKYALVNGPAAVLSRLDAPPEPVLARLHALQSAPVEHVMHAMLEGTRVALAHSGTARGAFRRYREAVREAQIVVVRSRPVVVPTHPWANAMHRALLSGAGVTETNAPRLADTTPRAVVRASDTNPSARRDAPDGPGSAIFETPRTTLLKTHVDLVSEIASRAAHGEVRYAFTDALHRLGYLKQSHGAFDSKTMSAHAARVAHLLRFEVSAHASTDSTPLLHAPFWREGSREKRRVVIAPGGWWDTLDVSKHHTTLPAAVLALPTDGRGHEVHRVAFRVALELAVWNDAARTGVRLPFRRTLGTLLERAGVATLADLRDDVTRRGNRARRLRAYLFGNDGLGGAFALLARLGAPSAEPMDERAVWTTGPFWLEAFWNAPIRPTAPNVAPKAPASAKLTVSGSTIALPAASRGAPLVAWPVVEDVV